MSAQKSIIVLVVAGAAVFGLMSCSQDRGADGSPGPRKHRRQR